MTDIVITGTLGQTYGVFDFESAADRAGPGAVVRLECGGGDSATGLAIADQIAKRQLDVHGSAVGSAAVAILAAGKRRALTADGYIFVHLSSIVTCGHSETLQAVADTMKSWDRDYAELVAARSRLQPADVLQMMRNETQLTAQQALAHGLIDEITPAAGLEHRQRDNGHMAARWEMIKQLREHMDSYARSSRPIPSQTLEEPRYQRRASRIRATQKRKLPRMPQSPYAGRFTPLAHMSIFALFLQRIQRTTAPVRFAPLAWLDDKAQLHHEPPPPLKPR